jgi:hypothetical protein
LISVRRIPRSEFETKLRSYGCTPLEGKGQLNTAHWWCWPWGGPPFTVPFDPDDMIDDQAARRLMLDMVRAAPLGWVFPNEE